MRFPSLRQTYSNRKGSSYYDDLHKYFTRWGYRILNDLHRSGYLPPTHDQLATIFDDRIRQRGRTYDAYDGKRPGLDSETVDRLTTEAAEAVLRDWSPAWIDAQADAGRRGGMKSRRPPTKATPGNLAALELLSGMTRQEQAQALGVSVRTVHRLVKSSTTTATLRDQS